MYAGQPSAHLRLCIFAVTLIKLRWLASSVCVRASSWRNGDGGIDNRAVARKMVLPTTLVTGIIYERLHNLALKWHQAYRRDIGTNF